MKRTVSFFLPVVMAFLLGACADDSDQGQPRTLCGVGLYERVNYTKYTVDSLTVKILGPDTIWYRNTSTDVLSLPLRYVGDTSRFELRRGTRIPDTLTVIHKNTPHFLSMDAGYAMYYELLQVYSTQYAIDTTTVTSTTINTNEQENLSIYYPEY